MKRVVDAAPGARPSLVEGSEHVMTGQELYERLKSLGDIILPEMERFVKEKRTGEWWVLSGYLDILKDAMRRIDRHSERALQAYSNDPRIVALTVPNQRTPEAGAASKTEGE